MTQRTMGATAGAVGTADDFDGSSSQPTNEIARRTGIARFIFAPRIVRVADSDIGKGAYRSRLMRVGIYDMRRGPDQIVHRNHVTVTKA